MGAVTFEGLKLILCNVYFNNFSTKLGPLVYDPSSPDNILVGLGYWATH